MRKTLISLVALIVAIDISMLIFGPPKTLDAKLYYSGEQARALFASMSEADVHAYQWNEIFDLVLIAAYSAGSVIILRRLFPRKRFAVPLALLAGSFDLVETSTILMALQDPGAQSSFDWLGICTLLKWICGGSIWLAIACGYFRPGNPRTRASSSATNAE